MEKFTETSWSYNTNVIAANIGTVSYDSAKAIESLTLDMSSGNIASGTVQMYGVP